MDGFPYSSIFSCHPEDIKAMGDILSNTNSNFWGDRYSDLGYIYYWAYRYNKSSFDGGKMSGGRDNFQTMYSKAIQNILIENPNLTHAEIYKLFGVCYSHSYSIGIFNYVVNDMKKNKKGV